MVNKKDTVWVLGDIAWNVHALKKCGQLRGYKRAVLGNHDGMQNTAYMRHFRIHPGICRYRNYWLSHAPIHPDELRGIRNIHGHTHDNPIRLANNPFSSLDLRYMSVCVESLNGVPHTLEQLEEKYGIIIGMRVVPCYNPCPHYAEVAPVKFPDPS